MITASAALSFVGAAPAQAATPAFEIFFSPDCAAGKSASRVYTGTNFGEAWVNDKYNSKQFGSAGFDQRIAYNAASVYVSNAQVQINYDQNLYWIGKSTGNCFNLQMPYRNQNRNWTTYPIG